MKYQNVTADFPTNNRPTINGNVSARFVDALRDVLGVPSCP
jgi:hypothetical protein